MANSTSEPKKQNLHEGRFKNTHISSEIDNINASSRPTRSTRASTRKRQSEANQKSEISSTKKQKVQSISVIEIDSSDSEESDDNGTESKKLEQQSGGEHVPVLRRSLRGRNGHDHKNLRKNSIDNNSEGIDFKKEKKVVTSNQIHELKADTRINKDISDNLLEGPISEVKETSKENYLPKDPRENLEETEVLANGKDLSPILNSSSPSERDLVLANDAMDKTQENTFNPKEEEVILLESEDETTLRRSWRVHNLTKKIEQPVSDLDPASSAEFVDLENSSANTSHSDGGISKNSSLVPISKTTELTKKVSELTCMICFKECKSLPDLDTHFGSHIRQKSYECRVCRKKLSTQRTLNDHMKVHAGGKQKCGICNRELSSMNALNEHMKIHTGERPYECTICQKNFRFRGNLADHMKTHNGDKYRCIVCNKRLSTKRNLTDHMRMHAGEKFQCAICQSELSSLGALNVHMASHERDKTYDCTVCERKLATKQNWTDHMATHAEIKPFECEICQKRLSSKKVLDVHMKSHTEEKSFACSICNAYLRSKQALIGHVAKHSKPKKYQCSICDEGINSKRLLATHMRIHA